MKWIAILMAVVMVASAAGAGYLYLNSTIRVDKLGVVATEAALQQASFDELKRQAEGGRVIGTLYSHEPIGEAADYQFLTYTVRLDNRTALTADMVEVAVTAQPQDVLQIGDEKPKALQGHSQGDISATILTTKGSNTIRELTVTYYIWGIPFSIKTAYRH